MLRHSLRTDDLAFFRRDKALMIEARKFHAWVGGDFGTALRTKIRIVN